MNMIFESFPYTSNHLESWNNNLIERFGKIIQNSENYHFVVDLDTDYILNICQSRFGETVWFIFHICNLNKNC